MNATLLNINKTGSRNNLYYKLALLLVILCGMASSANAQQVTYSGKKVSLKAALEAVKKQTGYVTIYNNNLIENAKPVSIQAVKMPLNDFLTVLLKDQPIQFSIASKTIILIAKPPQVLQNKGTDPSSQKKEPTIRVTIQDGNGGLLKNASIRVKGSSVLGYAGAKRSVYRHGKKRRYPNDQPCGI